jgi:acyl carrier protein
MTLDELCRVVALQLGRRTVDADERLVEDLGADSMDFVAVLATVEERTGVGLDETVFATVATVRELHARLARGAAE